MQKFHRLSIGGSRLYNGLIFTPACSDNIPKASPVHTIDSIRRQPSQALRLVLHHRLLFDKAYFDYRTMDLIDTNGGWFLTRLKPNSNPETTAEFRNVVVTILTTTSIDVNGEVGFKRRIYNPDIEAHPHRRSAALASILSHSSSNPDASVSGLSKQRRQTGSHGLFAWTRNERF